MTTLLISGSRDATPAMLDYTRRCVERALEHGWFIIAGDALGVDQAVADVGMRVYGLAEMPRHGIAGQHISYFRVENIVERIVQRGRRGVAVYEMQRPISYTERDKLMVREADKALCIWNGRSPGTLAVYRYALERGKEAWLKKDGKSLT